MRWGMSSMLTTSRRDAGWLRGMICLLCATAAVVFVGPGLARAQAQVELPIERWNALRAADAPERIGPPPIGRIAAISRSVSGRFDKGLFTGEVRSRFRVLEGGGHVRVPVLDGSVSIGEARLNGRRTSLLPESAMYTVGIDGPGDYEITATFFWGEEQDRFSRRLQFSLPRGGSTRIEVELPEREIDATLRSGTVESIRESARGSVVVGYLDATGGFDLSWERRLSGRSESEATLEARAYALHTLGESLVTGVAAYEVRVVSGETDQLELDLPAGVEVLRVEGEAVLQWYTESGSEEKLSVLLRYLVDDSARIVVYFQHPVGDSSDAVPLLLPWMPATTVGYIGVQAPAGLAATVATVQDAEELGLRELPRELFSLSSVPLLTGFRFDTAPTIAFKLERYDGVELTSTVVDALQASTVVIEDGTEITKLKLRIRNNTRQYLQLALPAGSTLTGSRVDGVPVSPALTTSESEDDASLLFPLRQSERIGVGRERFHTVQAGETLSGIANFYYSEPSLWRKIMEANSGALLGGTDVRAGQRIRVPARSATVAASAFVLEIAYKRQLDRLGSVGRRDLELPEIDVDAVRVTWHVYLPDAVVPLHFDANLQQVSAIRYDPLRRLQQFLDFALRQRQAWAGESYQSILTQRKAIYREEAERKQAFSDVLSGFPLVGTRYRFSRVLLGRDPLTISVTFVDRNVEQITRWFAFLLAFALTGLVLLRRNAQTWIGAACGVAILLVLGHYVLGVHRRLVWGFDAALIVAFAVFRLRPWVAKRVEAAKQPEFWLNAIRFGNVSRLALLCLLVASVLIAPLLLSSAVGLLMVVLWRITRPEMEGQNA